MSFVSSPASYAGGYSREEVSERMNIVVLVKQVPDTEADRKLNPADNTVDRGAVDPVINYIDEFAIEEGLRLKEAHGGEVTILTVGPERATESIRKALSMGADKAVHVSDEALHGSDAIQTAKVIAKALGTIEWDVADRRLRGDRLPHGRRSRPVAEVLGAPQLTQARKVTVDGSTVTIERVTDTGYESVAGHDPGGHQRGREDQRPALPVLQGHHGGQEQADPGPVALGDLGLDAGEVGLANAMDRRSCRSRTPRRARPGRRSRTRATAARQIADYLAVQEAHLSAARRRTKEK